MSLLSSHRYLSPYLATPNRSQRTWPRLAYRKWLRHAQVLWRYRPHLPLRSWIGLALWAVILTVGMTAYNTQADSFQPPLVSSSKQANVVHAAGSRTTAPATKAAELPDGPTGQLLPPGTLAPVRTYANSYAAGQCTWYVAGRRPVPGNWGNARTWYSRAQAAGWSVGTTPAKAAIAWTSAGYYGHVAVVEDVDVASNTVLVSEMNYTGLYRISKRWVNANAFKYIY